MRIVSQILRYQQGSRSRHPAPDATIASSQSGTLTQQGEQLAVLVDLNPLLPYRSREIRTLAVKTYWSSTGSTVARLRRALAAANRYLVRLNEEANASAKCAGSITCAVFAQEELFLGQVGTAHAYILHGPNSERPSSKHRFEVFPERNRLMISLGNALPPAIHISFTHLEPGSTVFIASTSVAESQAREMWQQAMSMPVWPDVSSTINKTIANNHASGTVIVCRVSADIQPGEALSGSSRRTRRVSQMQAPAVTSQQATPNSQQGRPVKAPAPVPARLEPKQRKRHDSSPAEQPKQPTQTPRPAAPTKPLLPPTSPPFTPAPQTRRTATYDGLEIDTDTGEILDEPLEAPKKPRRKTDLSLARTWIKTFFVEMKQSQPEASKPKLSEKQQLRLALRSLLPEKESAPPPKPVRKPPQEQTYTPALIVALTVLVALVTVFMNAQLGGTDRIATMEEDLLETRNNAYNTQDKTSWEMVEREAADILALDETNEMAGPIYQEALGALQALETAAILDATQLYELPATTGKRKILLAENQLFVLDTTTDAVFSFQLTDDLRSFTSNVDKPILRSGQDIEGVPVGNLIDIAWVPVAYRDTYGALYILGDNGTLFIYEPSVGTGDVVSTIHVQQLSGDLAMSKVVAMDTFGAKIFVAHRDSNEILTYNPINGYYDLSQSYFSVSTERDLNLAFDIAINERIYVLMADGEVNAYYGGTRDYAFTYDGVSDQPFDAQVIAVDQELSSDKIYLGDPQAQRIALFNKRGRLLHLFRANNNQFAQLETMTVNENKGVLYFIAGNRLYVAPLPGFVN